MATIELTSNNSKDTIANNEIVLIDFWAEWCGPCKSFGPVFEAASDKNPDVKFAKCNTEVETELAAEFGIRSIPTVAVFRQGILLFMQPGALPPNALDDLLAQVRAVDMADVHKEMAEQAAATP
jgi:thioredoxin